MGSVYRIRGQGAAVPHKGMKECRVWTHSKSEGQVSQRRLLLLQLSFDMSLRLSAMQWTGFRCLSYNIMIVRPTAIQGIESTHHDVGRYRR